MMLDLASESEHECAGLPLVTRPGMTRNAGKQKEPPVEGSFVVRWLKVASGAARTPAPVAQIVSSRYCQYFRGVSVVLLVFRF